MGMRPPARLNLPDSTGADYLRRWSSVQPRFDRAERLRGNFIVVGVAVFVLLGASVARNHPQTASPSHQGDLIEVLAKHEKHAEGSVPVPSTLEAGPRACIRDSAPLFRVFNRVPLRFPANTVSWVRIRLACWHPSGCALGFWYHLHNSPLLPGDPTAKLAWVEKTNHENRGHGHLDGQHSLRA